ncbi:hypothetical protein J6G99_05695 [bacterium]|nr:hypothetical protein [bacterium]
MLVGRSLNNNYNPHFNAKFEVKGCTDSILKGFTKDFKKAILKFINGLKK